MNKKTIIKQNISKFVKLISILLMSFPVLYIFFVTTLFNIDFKHSLDILLRPSYYFVTLCAALAGYGFWEMKRWSWYIFLIFQVFLAFGNANFLIHDSDSHYKIILFFLSLLGQCIFSFRLARYIRVPYLFPKIRWWESNPRYRLSIPVDLNAQDSDPFKGEILDLSMAGCFVKVRQEFNAGEKIFLKFQAFDVQFYCQGIVIWKAQSTVTHPKGVGVKFLVQSKSQRRALHVLSRKLKKVDSFYKKSGRPNHPAEGEALMKQLQPAQPELGAALKGLAEEGGRSGEE